MFSSGGRNYLKRITAAASNSYVARGDNAGHGRSWNVSKNQIKGKFLNIIRFQILLNIVRKWQVKLSILFLLCH